MREDGYPSLPAVGEYWSGDLGRLLHYLDAVDNEMSLFDVALHYNFFHASERGSGFDMSRIFENTLVAERPANAVTFVDNHDTQYGQSLESFISDWFKPLAYALVLLRQDGLPCVFYSDYYGNSVKNRPLVPNLGKMIKIRRFYAYGDQEDYFDDPHCIGWTRGGDDEHPDSALAVLMSNAEENTKRMWIGKRFAGESFYDALGKCSEPVTVDEDGWGVFRTESGSVSIWVRAGAFEDLVVNE